MRTWISQAGACYLGSCRDVKLLPRKCEHILLVQRPRSLDRGAHSCAPLTLVARCGVGSIRDNCYVLIQRNACDWRTAPEMRLEDRDPPLDTPLLPSPRSPSTSALCRWGKTRVERVSTESSEAEALHVGLQLQPQLNWCQWRGFQVPCTFAASNAPLDLFTSCKSISNEDLICF